MVSCQQIAAAKNIATVFAEKKIRYALLKAECQAGKTGAFQTLISEMLRSGEIQCAYILCGSNDTELRTQAKEDTKKYNGGAPITVLFRQDFKDITMDITNCLIVVDESHMDAGTGMQMDQFLGKHGLSMDGNPKMLKENNAFLLSVSATPYAEICALKHCETPYEKHVENLLSGDGYFGLSQYLYGGMLKPTFDVVEDAESFAALFSKTPKYALVRMTHGKHSGKQEFAIKSICSEKGYKVFYNTDKRNEISFDALETAPSVNTLIIISGRLRAGKVVCKKHIAFVWEGAESSDTAALVQGLPGRMCGYEFGTEKPLIFMPPSALDAFPSKVVKASEIERAIMCPELMPRNSKFLVPGAVASRPKNGKTQCPPIRLVNEGDEEEWRFTDELKDKQKMSDAELKECCFNLLKRNLSLIRENINFSDEQKEEILEKILSCSQKDRHVRRCGDFSQRTYYKSVLEAHSMGTTPSEQYGDCDFLNFVCWTGSKLAGAIKRHIYVIFYTDASSGVPGFIQTPLNARVPKTNGKSQFSVHDADFREPIVAGGVVGFSAANIKTPVSFEKSLRDYIMLYTDSDLTVARKIESAAGCFQLDKAEFGYKSSKENKVQEICKKLGVEFGYALTVKFAKSSTKINGHFNVKTITW